MSESEYVQKVEAFCRLIMPLEDEQERLRIAIWKAHRECPVGDESTYPYLVEHASTKAFRSNECQLVKVKR